MAAMTGRMTFHQAPVSLLHFKMLSVQAFNRNPRSKDPSSYEGDPPPTRKRFGSPFL